MYKFNKAEILEDGTIQLREEEVLILQDGTEYNTGKYHRRVFTPDMELTDVDDATCNGVATGLWTKEVKDKYKTKKNKDGLL